MRCTSDSGKQNVLSRAGYFLRAYPELVIRTLCPVLLGPLIAAVSLPANGADYQALIAEPSASRLTATYQAISAVGGRIAGSTGEAKALDYAESRLNALGLKCLREPFQVTVPDPMATAELTVGSEKLPLLPLWPNFVRTSTCDISGPLVDGGDGTLEALSHKTIRGSIVLLDFRSENRWLNAAMMGARAIVFRSPPDMSRSEAEAKFSACPLDVPRFFLPSSESPPVGLKARIVCRQDWVASPSANLVADAPGSDPRLAGQPIVIWAYADSMSIVPGEAPGAEQSGGLAALLELAEILVPGSHRRPIEFVVSGAHCLGLQGAREFVDGRFSSPGQTPLLVATLDLSTSSRGLGVFGRGYDYNYRDEDLDSVIPLCRVLRHHAEQLAPILGETPRIVLTDGVNNSDNRSWQNDIPAKVAFDCEPFMSAGYNSVTFATIDDARDRVDTPDDTFSNVNVENLLRQIQVLTVMFHHILNDRIEQAGDDVLPLTPASPTEISQIGGFATARGYVAVYDPTKSLVPDLRVPDSLAVLVKNRKTMMGVRGNEVQLTDGPQAAYRFIGLPPLTDYATLFKPDTIIVAYHLDPATGRIDYAPDEGAFGADQFPTLFGMKTSSRTSPIVVFPCVETNLFGLVDPEDLTPFTTATVIDPVGGGRPRNYGFARAGSDESTPEEAEDSAVLFLTPGQKFQLLMGSALGENRLLLTNSTPENKAGVGSAVGDPALGDVPLATAKDIWAINQSRIIEFKRYRIVGTSVMDLQSQAATEIDLADRAASEQDWADVERHARAAWGFALRAHPILQNTGNDVVDGVIFYSLLLIPFSVFFERLVFACRNLTKQIGATICVFIAAFGVLRFVHPAFDIVASPSMIFVGFVMGALSLIVTVFIVGKFESAMRSVKQAASGVRELDVRRSNVAMAAFSLGISNLRRRKTRTLLTTLTLIVMTFIVLSFTSIVPELQLHQTASPNPARYSGMLLRDPGLQVLQGSAYEALANEFAGRAVVVRRVFSRNIENPGSSQMSIQHDGIWADASAMEGFDAGEDKITRPQEALLPGGRWFRPGERNAIILPDPVAVKLHVQAGGDVRFMGSTYLVAGVFDPAKMKMLDDLDGESIIPPDFTQSTQKQDISRTQTQAFRKFIRLDPSVCFFLPAQTALDLGGGLRSVAVGFANPADTEKAMEALMPRLRLNLYASVPTSPRAASLEVRQFSVLQGSKSTGLALILIQLVIAAVFVLNTMIASVYERTREISIFSAIGLAPNHIATLFFAESLVFGVLGVVFGYFADEAVAKIVVSTGAYPQLTLNFSSTSAIMSAFLVMGTVLASTIYPARKAAQIAAPAMAEQALESEPEGDLWTLPLPFSVASQEARPIVAFLADWLKAYEEYTIGEFVTSGTRMTSTRQPPSSLTHSLRSGQAPAAQREEWGYQVSSTAWLAPYDLNVSQELLIEAGPAPVEGTYALSLTLRRLTGEPRDWVTLNRRFLTSIRRQFLAWRTLSEAERERFTAQVAHGGGEPAHAV